FFSAPPARDPPAILFLLSYFFCSTLPPNGGTAMNPTRCKRFCLPLACLLALSACAPGTAGSAEPAPIEVPPPVEQTNEGLTIFYTDYIGLEAKLLDAAVTQFNQLHPDNSVTAEKIFVDGSSENQDNAYTKMLTE